MIRFTDEQRDELFTRCRKATDAMLEFANVAIHFLPAMSGFVKNEAS